MSTRWRMPPESWCGIVAGAARRLRDADRVEQFDGAGPRRGACGDAVDLERLGDLIADRERPG